VVVFFWVLVECVGDAQLPSEDVTVEVLKSGLGEVTEADVDFAANFDSVIVGFNVTVSKIVAKYASTKNVLCKTNEVIYEVMNDIRDTATERMPMIEKSSLLGAAEVKEIFNLNSNRKQSSVCAGLNVLRGLLDTTKQFRVIRDDQEIFVGSAKSLRQFKESVPSVAKGNECGLQLDKFSEFKRGDRIECFDVGMVRAPFDDTAAREFRGWSDLHADQLERQLERQLQQPTTPSASLSWANAVSVSAAGEQSAQS